MAKQANKACRTCNGRGYTRYHGIQYSFVPRPEGRLQYVTKQLRHGCPTCKGLGVLPSEGRRSE